MKKSCVPFPNLFPIILNKECWNSVTISCTIGKGHTDNIIDNCLCDKHKELGDKIIGTCPQFNIPEPRNTSSNLEPFRLQRLQSPILTSSSSTPVILSSDGTENDTTDTSERPPGQEGNNVN